MDKQYAFWVAQPPDLGVVGGIEPTAGGVGGRREGRPSEDPVYLVPGGRLLPTSQVSRPADAGFVHLDVAGVQRAGFLPDIPESSTTRAQRAA